MVISFSTGTTRDGLFAFLWSLLVLLSLLDVYTTNSSRSIYTIFCLKCAIYWVCFMTKNIKTTWTFGLISCLVPQNMKNKSTFIMQSIWKLIYICIYIYQMYNMYMFIIIYIYNIWYILFIYLYYIFIYIFYTLWTTVYIYGNVGTVLELCACWALCLSWTIFYFN